MIEVVDCPLPASFQDAGRPGYRHLGVPLSGALDPQWLAIANALVGNPPQTVALEMRLLGPKLRAKAPVTIALAGDFSARIEDAAGQSRPAANWCSHVLAAGETSASAACAAASAISRSAAALICRRCSAVVPLTPVPDSAASTDTCCGPAIG
jgi:allophanate hydrolase subunit 2